ncbi:hypothetical protein H0H92_005086 [Tricholoma furcatifolium]|nr:hypothetical protein H0H92_005086 [Tricholoma furcatifolium]
MASSSPVASYSPAPALRLRAPAPFPLDIGPEMDLNTAVNLIITTQDGEEVMIAVNPRKEDGKVYLADWKVKLGEEKVEVGDCLLLWRGHRSGLRQVEWREALKAEPEGTITLFVQ